MTTENNLQDATDIAVSQEPLADQPERKKYLSDVPSTLVRWSLLPFEKNTSLSQLVKILSWSG